MGLLIKGEWKDQWYNTQETNGRFVREDAQFHHCITARSADSDNAPFPVARHRYHLFVSYACPWAHRTLIVRSLKGLKDIISVSVVTPDMLEHGWEFYPDDPYLTEAKLPFRYLHQIYTLSDRNYSGRVTVPVLWDKESRTIVNNESAEIIRIFNSAFGELTPVTYDFYPLELRARIDEINERVYHTLNNGVYQCGFASTQDAYEKAFRALFDTLDHLEVILADQPFLAGNIFTEADIRLFTTLIRFDAVYYGHFKTNLKRISDYHHLWNYLRDIYQMPGVSETVHLGHIKRHYYYSHGMINPTRIVPMGPLLDFTQPHDRHRFPHQTLFQE